MRCFSHLSLLGWCQLLIQIAPGSLLSFQKSRWLQQLGALMASIYTALGSISALCFDVSGHQIHIVQYALSSFSSWLKAGTFCSRSSSVYSLSDLGGAWSELLTSGLRSMTSVLHLEDYWLPFLTLYSSYLDFLLRWSLPNYHHPSQFTYVSFQFRGRFTISFLTFSS